MRFPPRLSSALRVALLSDRPYRGPWPEEEVVEAFFELDLEEIPIPERVERDRPDGP